MVPVASNSFRMISRNHPALSYRCLVTAFGTPSLSARPVAPFMASRLRQLSGGTDVPVSDAPVSKKNLFGKIWSRFSVLDQRDRAVQASFLYAAAEQRAMDACWYTNGRLPRTFRAKHMIMALHVWLIHQRLSVSPMDDDPDDNLIVQENLFETMWTDATGRIRVEPGVTEMMVNKYLKQTQQLTFTSFMHYDHAVAKKTHDEVYSDLSTSLWHHIYQSAPDIPDDPVHRLTDYVLQTRDYILNEHSSEYWKEGRTPFTEEMVVDFSNMVDNDGKPMKNIRYDPANDPWYLPGGWLAAQSEPGERYYWHPETREVRWDLPVDVRDAVVSNKK